MLFQKLCISLLKAAKSLRLLKFCDQIFDRSGQLLYWCFKYRFVYEEKNISNPDIGTLIHIPEYLECGRGCVSA